MADESSQRTIVVNRIFSVLAALCALIGLLGIAFDFVPGASPGLNLPQLTMIVGGLVLALGSFHLRNPRNRIAVRMSFRQHIPVGLALTLLTLLALEFALVAAGFATYFPHDVPEKFLDPVPWWTCDQAGCHYVYDEMITACERGDMNGLRCTVNRQGFHDTQDFVVEDDYDHRLRVLVLGDSFAFGGSADLGKSFVETIEQHFPQAVVWNTAIPGSGTNQALMSFNAYAPILKPQVTILGFYMNDFDDNMMPVDSYFMGVDSVNFPLSIRQYQLDLRGNLIKLDRQSDLFYRYHRVNPPVNDIHRIVGNTRLGTIALRAFDAVQQMISKAEGSRVSRRVEVTGEYLRALRDASAGQTQLLALLIPRREDIAATGTLYQHALRLLTELEIDYIDPKDALDSELDYAPPTDVHWSNAGHQKIGKILIECLELFTVTENIAECAS